MSMPSIPALRLALFSQCAVSISRLSPSILADNRFLYDMFMNLNADVSHRLEASTMASFLEIYGEDVYDLLSDGHAPGTKRASLQASQNTHHGQNNCSCSFNINIPLRA